MTHPRDQQDNQPHEEDELPLSEPEPTAADYRPEVYPRYDEANGREAVGEKPFQFTLGELLGLVGGAAVVLAILGCIPGGYSAEVIAGIAGIGLLASLIVLAWIQPSRPILQVAWWTLLVFYAMASLVAVIRSLS